MIKKLLAALLTFTIGFSLIAVPVQGSSYYDVEDGQYYTDAIEALTIYGVVSGFDGSFRPYDNVTRAEFAKMASLIGGFEEQVYSNAGTKRFDDVPLSHWATGYINTTALNKILVGYPNGNFQPEKDVTYAEAVTVVLRTLDYSSTELGDNWPYSYMVKASGLGLTAGLDFTDNDPISRADLAVIINRALQTDLNNNTLKLVSKLDVTSTDDVFIIATNAEDSTLAQDEIRTESGVFKLANTKLNLDAPSKGTVYFNKDNKIINFEETDSITQLATTVDNIVNDEVYFANGTSGSSLGVSNNTGVLNDGTLTTYGVFKSNIKKGAQVSVVFDEYNSVKLLMFGNADYTEAVTVYSDIYSALAKVGVSKDAVDSATVIRDGYAATLDDVEVYDVAYYLAEDAKIYLYSDKISGTYNEAYPNKANVTSIELSGNTFELETPTAINKLGEKSGSYKIGSKITALLGMDGKIVDVVELNTSDRANYGILLSYNSEMATDVLEEGKQYNYITVINGEGNTMKYKSANDYSSKIGDVGKISFDEKGNAVFATLSSTKIISGEIDKNNRKIGDHWLTNDCVIIERTYAPIDRSNFATADVIDFEDISSSALTGSQVLHAVTVGDFGDISLLFVDDLTKNQYNYGIIKNSTSGLSNSYEIYAYGTTSSYYAEFYNSLSVGTAVAFQYTSPNKLIELKRLVSVESLGVVSAADVSRIKIGNKVYKISDDVQIVKKKTSASLAVNYEGISKNDIEEIVGKTVTVYTDTTASLDGLVRIIVVHN